MSLSLRSNPAPVWEPEPDPYTSSVSFQEYAAILKRRRGLILLVFVMISVVGVIVTLLTKPVYQAQGKLLVDAPGMTVNQVSADSPLSGLFGLGATPSTATVAEVLETVPLQQQVVQKDGQVDFAIASSKDTDVVMVQAEGPDAHLAAQAVNDLMQNYIQQNSDQSVADLENTIQFAQRQSNASHRKLSQTEDALRTFKERNHITDIGQNRTDQITLVDNLSRDYQQQQAQKQSLEARLSADLALVNQQPIVNTYVLPTTNPTVETLKQNIVQLQVQRKSLTGPGGFNPNGKAPILKQVDAQIAEYQRQIALQPKLLPNQTSNPNSIREGLNTSIADLRGQINAVTAQIGATKGDLDRAQAALGHYPDQELRYQRLARDRDTAATSAQVFDKGLADLSLREKARRVSAHIIDPALPPPTPVRPKKALNIAFACLMGLFIGICLALLQEFLDDRINTVEDADRILGLPSLGRVPAMTTSDPRLLPQMTGFNPASESYRILRTNIHFASIDKPLTTMLVASSAPGEGKTTTAVNLAFAMAMDGKRVILVDSDLRRPTIHKMLGLPATPGLTDVLAGTANLDDVLMQHSDLPNLIALPCGSIPPNPSEIIGSRAFQSLLERLTTKADLVILDSPPVLAAADAQILASQVDGVVLVVEAGQTRKVGARQTLALLRHARANVLGVTYNKLTGQNGSYYQYAASALTGNGKNGSASLGKQEYRALPDTDAAEAAYEAKTTQQTTTDYERE